MKNNSMNNIVPDAFFGFQKVKEIVYKGTTRAPSTEENFKLNPDFY